jgi:mRNA interferase HigB
MIREFSRIHPDALPSLSIWYEVVRRAGWKNFAELKADFASADQVDRRTVFNIGGGKYRLIARVNYRGKKVFILFIMKHSEYTRNRWK